MPWDHCDIEFILDDEPCPKCGVEKAAWTVQVEKTRTLRIKRITLKDIGGALDDVARERGIIVARRMAAALDHGALATLCRRWHDDPAREGDNDPNRWVHPRYMLLLHMDDDLLPADAREGLYEGDDGGPVLEMCRAIALSGVPCKISKVFDEEVLVAWRAWRALDRRRLTVTRV